MTAGLRLVLWTCLGVGGLIDLMLAGLAKEWPLFILGLLFTLTSIFMLGTGLFLGRHRVR